MLLHLYLYGTTVTILSQAFGYDNCNRTYSNDNGLECFPCEPGYTPIVDCPGNFTRAICEECQDGTYQPECVTFNGNVSCKPCTVCDVYKENCTIYKDAVCELKNGTHDSNDDSGAQSGLVEVVVGSLIGCLILVILSTIYAAVVCCFKKYRKVNKDLIRRSNYGIENQSDGNANDKETDISEIILNSPTSQTRSDGNREERYKETTNRFSVDVVQETSINEDNDKSSIHNVDGNDLAPRSNKKERHIAVVRPNFESKSNDCKEVENSDDILQHRTRESFQVAGDSENTQVLYGAEDSESKRPKSQLCHRTEDQSLSLRDRDIIKG